MAVLVWLGVALVAMAASPKLRPGLVSVIRAFVAPQILLTIAALAAWTTSLIVVPAVLGIHFVDPWTEATIWFIGVGFVLLLNSTKALRQEHWFRERAGRLLGATVLVEFFVNLAVFSLAIEIVLFPCFVLLGALSAVTSTDKELAQARGCVDSILGLVFAAMSLYVIVRLLTDWDSFANAPTLERLLLPAWLSLGAFPFIYCALMASAYRRAVRFVRSRPASRSC